VLFINKLPLWIVNSIRMFVADMKLWANVHMKEESLILHKDLDNLLAWTKDRLLRFNPEKCKVMHIGHKIDTKYYG